MPTISNPTLTIHRVEGHPAQRRVEVTFEVTCEAGDVAVGSDVVAHVIIHAVDEHDAPVQPRQTPILETEETFVATGGVQLRSLVRTVHRADLDVEQDWWSAGQSGEPEPIAEWLDHLAADIRLQVGGEVAAEATTPVVTGSWGALGHD